MFLTTKAIAMINNNRFKFRVWDVVSKSYYKWHQSSQLVLRPSGHVTDGSVSIDSQYLQFCTGLKDSKNKLIFEGDIVEISTNYQDYLNSRHGLIHYKDHRYLVGVYDPKYSTDRMVNDNYCCILDLSRRGRVAGNIFEHSALLLK